MVTTRYRLSLPVRERLDGDQAALGVGNVGNGDQVGGLGQRELSVGAVPHWELRRTTRKSTQLLVSDQVRLAYASQGWIQANPNVR